MAEDINLKIIAEISQAKQAMAELATAVKGIDASNKQVAKSAGEMDGQLKKAGRALAGLAASGPLLAVIAVIKKGIDAAKEFDSALAAIGKRQGARVAGQASMARLLTGVQPGDLAETMKRLQGEAAARGIKREEMEQLAGEVLPRMKRRTGEEQVSAMIRALRIRSAGGGEKELRRMARRPDTGEIGEMESRRDIYEAGTPFAQQARQAQVEQARLQYAQEHPATRAAADVMAQANAERIERLKRGQKAVAFGMAPAVSEEGVSNWEMLKGFNARFWSDLFHGRPQAVFNRGEDQPFETTDLRAAGRDLRETATMQKLTISGGAR